MKNIFKSLMLVAVAAMGFTACQKEGVEESTNNSVAESTYTMTFTAEAPESRTSVAIDGDVATYSWSVDESGNLTDRVVFLQTQDANDNVNYKYNVAEDSSISEGVATFVTEFAEVTDATAYNYAAIFPAQTFSGSALTGISVSLPDTQTLTEGTYDPTADLMMSKLIKNVETKNGHGGNLQFTRLAAIGKMNLKGVTAGETINKVVITFEEEVVNGNVTLDFENEAVTYAETGSNTITLKDSTLTAVEAGTPIFFTCFPGDYTGAYSVEVTTDVATYSTAAGKSIAEDKALSFTAGNVTNFNLTVGNRVVSNVEAYTKLTNVNLADYSGTYLLVYEDGNVAFDGSLTTLDAADNTTPVVINGNTIEGAYSANTFTIAKVDGGYSIQSASGEFIGSTSTNGNKLYTATTYSADYLNTIEDLVIKGAGGAPLQYNNASDQNRFRYFYKAGQKAIALYRQNGTGSDEEIQYVDLAKPTNLAATAEGNVVTVTWDAVENATNYDVTVVNGETTNVKTNSAELTLAYETTYTISVVAKGGVGFNDSQATTVEVTTGEQPATGGGDTELGAPWSYEWTANTNKITKNGTTTINGLDWSLTTTASNYAWDSSNNRGWQVGTAAGDVILKTSSYVGAVNKIELILSTNGSGNTASVSVGGTAFGAAQTISSGTANANKTYTFTSETPCSGEIVITLNDKAKSVYFKGISINPAN